MHPLLYLKYVNDVTIRFNCVTSNFTRLITFDQQNKKTKQHGQFTLSHRSYPDSFLANWIFRIWRRWNNSRFTSHRHYRYSLKGHFREPNNQVILDYRWNEIHFVTALFAIEEINHYEKIIIDNRLTGGNH